MAALDGVRSRQQRAAIGRRPVTGPESPTHGVPAHRAALQAFQAMQHSQRAVSSADVLALQRSIGNQATRRLLARSRQPHCATGDQAGALRGESGKALLRALETRSLDRARGDGAASPGGIATSAYPLQRYWNPEPANKDYRVSNSGNMAVYDKQKLNATPALIDAARGALTAAKAYVTLEGLGGGARQPVKLKWNPASVPADSHHRKVGEANPGGDVVCTFADCHRTSQAAMGSSSTGGVDTEHPVVATEGGRRTLPTTSRLEAKSQSLEGAHANRGVYAFFKHAFPRFAALLDGTPALKAAHADLIGQLRAVAAADLDAGTVGQSWNLYNKIAENAALNGLFSRTFGVNEAIKPKVGDALTQVNNETERKNAPDEVDLWNFHWAGVIMTDGDDYVTLENLSVENEDVINKGWYFAMYGAEQQSFHTEQMTSEHVGKSPLSLGFRSNPALSAASQQAAAERAKAVLAGKRATESEKALGGADAAHTAAEAAARNPVAAAATALAEARAVAAQQARAVAETSARADEARAAAEAAEAKARDIAERAAPYSDLAGEFVLEQVRVDTVKAHREAEEAAKRRQAEVVAATQPIPSSTGAPAPPLPQGPSATGAPTPPPPGRSAPAGGRKKWAAVAVPDAAEKKDPGAEAADRKRRELDEHRATIAPEVRAAANAAVDAAQKADILARATSRLESAKQQVETLARGVAAAADRDLAERQLAEAEKKQAQEQAMVTAQEERVKEARAAVRADTEDKTAAVALALQAKTAIDEAAAARERMSSLKDAASFAANSSRRAAEAVAIAEAIAGDPLLAQVEVGKKLTAAREALAEARRAAEDAARTARETKDAADRAAAVVEGLATVPV